MKYHYLLMKSYIVFTVMPVRRAGKLLKSDKATICALWLAD